MTLLITIFAAVISTVIWYKGAPANEMKVSTLCFMYWGASIMWSIDAVFEYAELGAEYFMPNLEDMLNDAYLGISVVVLGLVIWLVTLLASDPKGVLRATLIKK